MPTTPPSLATTPRRETCLVVPGHARRMHHSAFAAGADEVVFDLEDAVAPADRAEARGAIAATLAEPRWAGRAVAVRINPPGSPDLADDLRLCRELDTDAQLSVVVPKVESAGHLDGIAAELGTGGASIALQALIETAAGLEAAGSIARAACRPAALIVGYVDLTASLGRRGTTVALDHWLVVQERVLHAARAAGIRAIDGPYVHLADTLGLAGAAARARALGFDGAWAIHPNQLPVIRRAFAPSARELARAHAVATTLDTSAVARLDGEMVDEATGRAARRLLDRRNGHTPRAARDEDPRCVAPWFEDLHPGASFHAPGLTLTEGHAALHQAVVGDRLALALDRPLAEQVGAARLAHPMLVTDVAIGQSTWPSSRVLGNLFYRGLTVAPVAIGATLRTTTTVVARRRSRGREHRGLVVLRMTTTDQDGRTVLDAYRCPLLPARGPAVPGEHDDDLDTISADVAPERIAALVPPGWDLAPLRAFAPPGMGVLSPGEVLTVEARDTVTAAPELARLTMNVAMAHLDAAVRGRRLVYGGHVIGIAAAHITRALPQLATILAWRSCEHLGPVLEGDRLRSTIEIEDTHAVPGGTLARLRVRTSAERDEVETDVLDWRPVVLLP